MADVNRNDTSKYYIQPDAGLGNRLYCLYSALYYQKATGRPFDVIWLRENCCNVPFDALFNKNAMDKSIRIITTWHLGYKNRYAVPSIISNIYMAFVRRFNKYYTAESTREVYNKDGENGIKKIINEYDRLCIKANGKFFDVSNFDIIRNEIVPAKAINDMVDDIMNTGYCGLKSETDMVNNGNAPTIGIHIRRTDNKTSIANSPVEAFTDIMSRLVENDQKTRFYLATDDELIENELKSKYNIIPHKTFGETKSRDSVTGIMDAYVDMLCLSRCDKIYGSYGSSFSEMAALIGNKPIEIVVKEN